MRKECELPRKAALKEAQRTNASAVTVKARPAAPYGRKMRFNPGYFWPQKHQ